MLPLALCALLFGAIKGLNGGFFTYTLDDPYIHLALAENILRGQYGINLHEPSSPSSSIAFPFLLAGAMALGLDAFGPLAINLAALAATLAVLWTTFRHPILGDAPNAAAWAMLLTVATAICLNAIGVAFTGMEHSLHGLLTVLVCYGLFRADDRGVAPAWLPVALALQPVLRFEGAAILLAGAWFLAARGHRRQALAALAGAAAMLAIYGFFMAALGLPLLPSSVMVKLAPETAWTARALQRLGEHGAVPAILALAFFAYRLLGVEGLSLRPASVLLQAALIPVVAHLLCGRFGWLERYEVYLNLWIVLMGCRVLREPLRRWTRSSGGGVVLAIVVAGYMLARQGAMNLMLTPVAANNIHEQQYQMHRFVTGFYRDTVAVNDLGYVSFHNDRYVLDLWGLGSERARRLRQGDARDWMAPLVAENGIGLAMVYEDWFAHGLPDAWRRVGRLKLGKRNISASRSVVSFYATAPARCPAILEALEAFKPSLPAGVVLDIEQGACATGGEQRARSEID